MPAGTRWSAAVASLQHGIDALQETMKTSQQQQQENLAEPWRISLQDGDMSCETVGLAGSIICFFWVSSFLAANIVLGEIMFTHGTCSLW
jgi:hypothetical protein